MVIEVVNRSLENLVRTLVVEHIGTWDLKLVTTEFAYNTTGNMTTCKSPHEIVYGLDLDNPSTLFLCLIIIEY